MGIKGLEKGRILCIKCSFFLQIDRCNNLYVLFLFMMFYVFFSLVLYRVSGRVDFYFGEEKG